MSQLDSLMASLPVDRIAAQVGVDPAEARSAIESILPSLVGGMQANVQDPEGAASLQSALSQHAGKTDLAGGAVDPSEIDTADGAKIAHHIFGDNEGAVADRLAAASGTNKSLIEKLIPVIAPIAMAWLASRFFGNDSSPQAETPTTRADAPGQQQGDLGGGLGDLLGGLLGGGAGSKQGGGGLGDLLGGLGGLLGGGRR